MSDYSGTIYNARNHYPDLEHPRRLHTRRRDVLGVGMRFRVSAMTDGPG